MDVHGLQEALTRKYGPLPGYAWAAIGAGAIVLVARRASSSSSGSSSPSFLTTPPAAAISAGDLGAGGGGGTDANAGVVDPALSFGLPSVQPDPVAVSDASSSAPQSSFALQGASPSMAIDSGYNAADYFAANPLPQGTTTAQALDALSQFPAATYSFGAAPGVDYSPPPTVEQPSPSVNPSNQPAAITTDPHPLARHYGDYTV